MPTFKFRATPLTHVQHNGYSTTTFQMFRNVPVTGEVTVDKPGDLAQALSDWAYATPLPVVTDWNDKPIESINAWSIHVQKPARWPSGFKQAGERSHCFVVGEAHNAD